MNKNTANVNDVWCEYASGLTDFLANERNVSCEEAANKLHLRRLELDASICIFVKAPNL